MLPLGSPTVCPTASRVLENCEATLIRMALYIPTLAHPDRVAQLVEQRTFNP